EHLVNHLRVTVHAVPLYDRHVPSLDPDRLVEVLKRERDRVEPSVLRLRYPFRERSMRQVAVYAHRHCRMTARGPAVILLGHDMTVGARGRVVAQVRGPLAVGKG